MAASRYNLPAFRGEFFLDLLAYVATGAEKKETPSFLQSARHFR